MFIRRHAINDVAELGACFAPLVAMKSAQHSAELRSRMVTEQIRMRGIWDTRVLAAMESVPREQFVSARFAEHAYDDRPLPIAAGQTISQPYVVAWMTHELRISVDDDVLEVGTGSGYAAAVLSRIARRVYTIERHSELADDARRRLARLGYDNIEVRCGDGVLGWPEHAPFAAIVVAAAGRETPPVLLDQLGLGGRLVMPVGNELDQQLIRVTRTGPYEFHREALGSVLFVPLIGSA